jgi:CBS domain-containing protein
MELKDITKEAVTVSEYTTLGEALELMLTAHTNTLLVTDADGKLTGEVSVSDLFDGIVPTNFNGDTALAILEDEAAFAEAVKAARDIPVSDFMSADFDSVYPDCTLIEVASIAIAHGRGRIPVVDHEERPIGMISRQGLKHILGRFLHQE